MRGAPGRPTGGSAGARNSRAPIASGRLSAATLARVFLRSFFLQAAWNPRGMQNLGFAHAMAPALAALYPDPGTRARATARHLELFHCPPYFAPWILRPGGG